jgi:hypothetical protein
MLHLITLGSAARRKALCLTAHNTHKEDSHASSGIRTRNPRKREIENYSRFNTY